MEQRRSSGHRHVESKTNFLRAVTGGSATATSRPLHRGRTLAVPETEIRRDDGKLAAKVTHTQIYQFAADGGAAPVR